MEVGPRWIFARKIKLVAPLKLSSKNSGKEVNFRTQMKPSRLLQKMLRASLWSVAQKWSLQLLGIFSTIITARILSPDDFGVMAQAFLVSGLVEALTAFGIEAALIRNPNATKDDYNTAWTMTILRGMVIGTVLFFLAHPLARFFNEPRLAPVFIAIAIYSLFSGVRNIGVIDFKKNFLFHKEFSFALRKRFIGTGVLLTCAMISKDYWAFVWSTAAIVAVDIFLSFQMSNYRPRITLKMWRSMFSFSKYIFIKDLSNQFGQRAALFIIGTGERSTVIGAYSLASELAAVPSTQLSMPISAALLPGLSKIAHDKEEVRRISTEYLGATVFIALPAAVGLAVTGRQIADVVFGNQWSVAGSILPFLAIAYMVRIVGANRVATLVAVGSVRTLAIQSMLTVGLRVAILLSGYYFYGLNGILCGVVLASVVNLIITLYWQSANQYMYISELLSKVWRYIVATIVMAIIVQLMERNLTEVSVPLLLSFQVVIGFFTYSLSCICLWWCFGKPNAIEGHILKRFVKF